MNGLAHARGDLGRTALCGGGGARLRRASAGSAGVSAGSARQRLGGPQHEAWHARTMGMAASHDGLRWVQCASPCGEEEASLLLEM
eukprot:5088735-Prymnesium_polylepis.1